MPPKGRIPNRPPRRRPKVAGHGQTKSRPAPTLAAESPVEPAVPAVDELAEPATEPAREPAFEQPDEPAIDQSDEPADRSGGPEAETWRPDELTAEPAAAEPELGAAPADSAAPAAKPKPRPAPTPMAPAQPAGRRSALLVLAVLALVIVVFGTLALVFKGNAERADTGAANNKAVIDTGVNSEVVGQVSKAIETVLSYDYTKLDENEKAARDVITGEYVEEFDLTFAEVRKDAPGQKVVLRTTVLLAGVILVTGDKAELIATIDLAAARDGSPVNQPGRVKVTASKVDDRWKIAKMDLL